MKAIGQRTGVATDGTAYPALPSWLWSYDALGQVIAADSSVATNDRAYQYGAIGNRKKSSDSLTLPPSDNYISNAINQYTAIQQGGTSVSPVYDFDGNATAYPLPLSPTTNSTFLWDGENRLTEFKNAAGTILEQNLFDAGSRKIATTANGVTTLYLYDGWNCIAEYQGDTGVTPVLKKTRLWGTDFSGSMQGAGGVGCILSESSPITSNPITFNSSYPIYDGNGNVSEYLSSTGQVIAHYEYDPFGNTVVNTDTSNQFAYRFSTKSIGIATGLYYYGYRYYDPMTGRWPSRDPIEERGVMNLYAYLKNEGISGYDILGLSCPDCAKTYKDCKDAAKMAREFAIKELDAKMKVLYDGADEIYNKNVEVCHWLFGDDGFLFRSCEYAASAVQSETEGEILIMHGASWLYIENRYNNKLVECGQDYWECSNITHYDSKGCKCPAQPYDPS